MKVIFDSNVWIAYFNISDSQHSKAEDILNQEFSKVFMPEYVVLEVASVLQIKAGQKTANTFLKKVEKSDQVEILFSDKNSFTQTKKVFIKQKKMQLSFVDCFLLCLSKEFKIISFDKALNKVLNLNY